MATRLDMGDEITWSITEELWHFCVIFLISTGEVDILLNVPISSNSRNMVISVFIPCLVVQYTPITDWLNTCMGTNFIITLAMCELVKLKGQIVHLDSCIVAIFFKSSDIDRNP